MGYDDKMKGRFLMFDVPLENDQHCLMGTMHCESGAIAKRSPVFGAVETMVMMRGDEAGPVMMGMDSNHDSAEHGTPFQSMEKIFGHGAGLTVKYTGEVTTKKWRASPGSQNLKRDQPVTQKIDLFAYKDVTLSKTKVYPEINGQYLPGSKWGSDHVLGETIVTMLPLKEGEQSQKPNQGGARKRVPTVRTVRKDDEKVEENEPAPKWKCPTCSYMNKSGEYTCQKTILIMWTKKNIRGEKKVICDELYPGYFEKHPPQTIQVKGSKTITDGSYEPYVTDNLPTKGKARKTKEEELLMKKFTKKRRTNAARRVEKGLRWPHSLQKRGNWLHHRLQ